MTGEDVTLELPEPPALAEPPGSLDSEPRTVAASGTATPFVVAGRRVCVVGEAWGGVTEVRAHPVRIAAGLDIAGAACDTAIVTPLGIERRLRLDDAVLIERIVVPRDAPAALFEWHAPGAAATIDLTWTADLDGCGPSGAPGSIRWRRSPWGGVLASDTGYRALFVVGHGLQGLAIEAVDGHAPGVRVRARIAIPTCGSAQLAMAGATDDATASRALRSGARGRAVVLARRGMLQRLSVERLSIATPEPTLGRELERARLRLADRLVDTPGVGRSLVAGYEPGRLSYVTADAVRGSLDSLLLGDFEAARDVLRFLGGLQDGAGLVPTACTTGGAVSPGDVVATTGYLLLAARFLAWTGDLSFLRGEWARLRLGCDPVLRAVAEQPVQEPARDGRAPAVGPSAAAALTELANAAEAIGDPATADTLRHAPAPAATRDVYRDDTDGALARVQRILGPEPDATRGRLVLRPRPPADWDRFEVRALAMGNAAVDVEYRRTDQTHRFSITQRRGSIPLRLILAPELPGALRAARVDGTTADLDPAPGGDRTQVPVQLALDHPRTLELRMSG